MLHAGEQAFSMPQRVISRILALPVKQMKKSRRGEGLERKPPPPSSDCRMAAQRVPVRITKTSVVRYRLDGVGSRITLYVCILSGSALRL
jgi:hypothetical protein